MDEKKENSLFLDEKRRAANSSWEKGFTLIELLIVITIIGILAVALLPSIFGAPSKAREAALTADAALTAEAAELEDISTDTPTLTSTNTHTPTNTQTSTNTATSTPFELILIAIPLRNANCRLGCSASYFDIVDTLFEGGEYMPLSGGDGWLLFRGPVSSQRCWVASSLLDLQYAGESISVEEANSMSLFAEGPSCPPIPTETPAPLPPPAETPDLPQCSDGIDNDGDGATDYGDVAAIASGDADRQCTSPDDNDEAN